MSDDLGIVSCPLNLHVKLLTYNIELVADWPVFPKSRNRWLKLKIANTKWNPIDDENETKKQDTLVVILQGKTRHKGSATSTDLAGPPLRETKT